MVTGDYSHDINSRMFTNVYSRKGVVLCIFVWYKYICKDIKFSLLGDMYRNMYEKALGVTYETDNVYVCKWMP